MLTVAGIGPGNIKYLTLDVVNQIKEADHILAFGRVAASLKDLGKDIVEVKKVDQVLQYISPGKKTLLLASGDPNFFGIVDFLKKKGVEVEEVLPGLSSFQYLMAKLQKSWQEASFYSLHGRDFNLEDLRERKLTILLIDKDNTPGRISRELKSLGLKGKIYVGYNLSYDDEKIIVKNIGEDIEFLSSLGVVVVENEMD